MLLDSCYFNSEWFLFFCCNLENKSFFDSSGIITWNGSLFLSLTNHDGMRLEASVILVDDNNNLDYDNEYSDYLVPFLHAIFFHNLNKVSWISWTWHPLVHGKVENLLICHKTELICSFIVFFLHFIHHFKISEGLFSERNLFFYTLPSSWFTEATKEELAPLAACRSSSVIFWFRLELR